MSEPPHAEFDLPFHMTAHARTVVAERKIHVEWIVATLKEPEDSRPDRRDPQLIHYLRTIPEFGGRVLCVVANDSALPRRVVTVFFDRRQTRSRP